MTRRRSRRIPLDLRAFGDQQDIFRLSGAVERSPSVDAWLMDDSVALRAMAREWFARMRNCGDDVRELMHDGCPVACVRDAPFGYVNSFKNHVNVGFFQGAMLDDPAGLLEGTGKRMRHVKLTADGAVNVSALSELIDAAYVDIKGRLNAPGPAREDASE
jgi:hypothetical protein